MIKDHEWLDLAVKSAQRNVADCIERSCGRHLNEHREQFLPKIEHERIYLCTGDDLLNMQYKQILGSLRAMNAYNNAYNSGGFLNSIGAMGNIQGWTQ